MMRILFRRFVLGLVVAAVLLVVTWQVWWRPVPVTAFEVLMGEISVESMGTGTLDARVSSTVSSKIHGRISQLAVDQGDTVERGQVLVELDDSDLRRQVEVAEASVDMHRASLARLQTDKTRAETVLRQARLEHDRVLDAYARGAASGAERDRAVEKLEVAQSELARSEAAILEARASIVVSERTLDHHRSHLEESVLTSPLTGIVVRRDRDPGDVVVPGSSIFRLIETETLWVSAWVDETAMGDIAVGQPARVVFRARPAHDHRGHVARIGREVDPELREFTVDVMVDELPAIWAVGQRAEVYVLTDHRENALAIPPEFVYVRDGVHGVWVSEKGRAQWRPIDVGLRGRAMIEIASGLASGDLAIRPPDAAAQRMLRPGRRVAVQ